MSADSEGQGSSTLLAGFKITCLACGNSGGEIAGAELYGEPYIAMRCPHCQRMIVKPANGTEWKEAARAQ